MRVKKLLNVQTASGRVSWTMALNLLALGLAVLVHYTPIPPVPADWEPFVLPIVLVINLLLRKFRTREPIV